MGEDNDNLEAIDTDDETEFWESLKTLNLSPTQPVHAQLIDLGYHDVVAQAHGSDVLVTAMHLFVLNTQEHYAHANEATSSASTKAWLVSSDSLRDYDSEDTTAQLLVTAMLTW